MAVYVAGGGASVVVHAAALAAWWLPAGVAGANCVAAYQPKGAASLAASYVNLANPGTNNAAPGVAPSFATGTGWTFNGSTQYLVTGISPVLSWSMLVRYANYATQDKYIIGIANGIFLGFAIAPNNSDGGRTWINGLYLYIPGAGGTSAGVYGIAGPSAYQAGAFVNSIPTEVIPAGDIYIGGVNNGSSALALPGAGDVLAAAIYNVTLNATQVGMLTASMAAL